MKKLHYNFWGGLIIGGALVLFCWFAMDLFDISSYENAISEVYNFPSQIYNHNYDGDYVASIISAKSVKISLLAILISAVGSYLTFIAFIQQKEANKIHRNDIKDERLIANYIKLMDTHRDLVKSVSKGDNLCGHGAFHFIFYELKSIYVHLVSKYPSMREASCKDIASYICFKIFMSGCTGNDDSKLEDSILSKVATKYNGELLLQDFMRSLEDLNQKFVQDRIPPACFVFAKYKDEEAFPKLPSLYKGNLERLSSYFNLIDIFMNMEKKESLSTSTALYREMFAMQFSIHESAILDFYFRYKKVENNLEYDTSLVELLCSQRKQFPATFDIDHEEFCKNVY